MAVTTRNLYGSIVVTDAATMAVARQAAIECYGVDDAKVSFINVDENKIDLNLNIKLKYGVNVTTVCDQLRATIKYNVEKVIGGRIRVINLTIDEIK